MSELLSAPREHILLQLLHTVILEGQGTVFGKHTGLTRKYWVLSIFTTIVSFNNFAFKLFKSKAQLQAGFCDCRSKTLATSYPYLTVSL